MAIKVQGRFATARDTAKTLGVPASRAEAVINAVKDVFTNGGGEKVVYRDSASGELVTRSTKRSGAAAKKSVRRNATTTVKTTAKASKSHG